MKSKNLSYLLYFGIFFVFSGLSYYIFNLVLPVNKKDNNISPQTSNNTPSPQKANGILSFEGPKVAACPLNGEMFTSEEQKIWQQRRPLTVMIENHKDARPQSGLANADIVYEAVAEGGITRFMGVFYCNAVKGAENKYDVGPVRSARTYFLDLASEYSDYPLYTHVGGSNCSAPKDPVTGLQAGPCTTNKKAQAIEQISSYGWNNKGTWGDLSQFSLPYKVCRREPERTGEVKDTEHTMYCSTKELWNTAADRGLTNITQVNKSAWDKNFRSWATKQKDESRGENAKISFDFWSKYSDYGVSWIYDKNNNVYTRQNGGAPHVDFNTQKPITGKNIVVQYSKESRSIDEHLHNLYDVVGTGKGILFQNGTKTDITWSKANRTSRTIFKDASGKEVNFVPGAIWVEILPIGNSVSYENNS